MWIDCRSAAILAAVSALSLGGCGGSPEPSGTAPEEQVESIPAAAAPTSLGDIFPAGLGRPMVMDTCGACHSAACSAIGQRTLARWESLKEDHRDKVSDMSDEDYNVLFAYLSENFNDAKPEPVVPPQFLEGGCTPF